MMGSIRRRLDRLDRLESGLVGGVHPPDLAKEVREIDETIRRLDREIEEVEATLSPEEVAETRRAHDAYMETLRGLSLDEAIVQLDMEIAKGLEEGRHE